MLLSSDIWGPHFWFFLHTTALAYPEHPNAIVKKKYFNLIQNLPTFLPNKRMGKQFAKKLNEFPVSPYLSSRPSLMKWVHFMHNKINRNLGKPEITFFKSLEVYYLNYETKKTKLMKEVRKKRKYVSAGVCIFFVFLIAYIYKKN